MERTVRILVSTDGELRVSYILYEDGINEDNSHDSEESIKKNSLIPNRYRRNMHIFIINDFKNELHSSTTYRKAFFNKLAKRGAFKKSLSPDLILRCKSNDSYIIDYKWCDLLCRDINFEMERESAFSWMSTLGGAYSALGDYSPVFAETALKISTQQIKLAAMAGDNDLIARGWLFLALALSQLGHGKAARFYFNKAYLHKSFDSRHMKMCLGVHTKLKYDAKVRRLKRKNGGYVKYDLVPILKALKL